MGSLSVMSLLTMVLPHVVLAESEDVKVEDKSNTVREASSSLAAFIVHPDMDHFVQMIQCFTLSKLSPILYTLLGSLLCSVVNSICVPIPEEPEDFVKKPWRLLEAHECETIKNEPYKYLRRRYRIDQIGGWLLPMMRLIFFRDTLNNRAALGF